jgi:hypothetical protein
MKPLYAGKNFIILSLIILTLIFAGCTKSNTTTNNNPPPNTTTTPPPTSTSTPKVTIVTPADGTITVAGDIAISVQVTDFIIVNKYGMANVSGEGHLHYFRDVDAPTDAQQAAVIMQYVDQLNTSYTWLGVPAGIHTFSVQLVNNDHTPVIPLAVAKITVYVQSRPPRY